MDAIGLNPIKLDAIGLDPIRMNAIRLGVPGASSGSGRPYIDPELLSHVKMAISTWGKSNDDPDRAVLKDLSGNGNDMRLLNFGFAGNSGYGPGTDFEGWLCTDGVDDIIESVNPVSEMLEGSSEITVVSIIHQIKINDSATVTNDIRNTNIASTSRNAVKVDGKTGIYGYSRKGTDDCVLINNILGDKTDYTVTSGSTVNYNNLFSVVGTQYGDYNSQIAYAGGFIANKSLTTDEINQIIAYFNLDRPGQIIKPQLYCNIKKQGITNDNHAEFNDQLIDFVGGHNIQLNNISWEGESGINSYPVVFGANKTWINLRTNDNIKWSYELTSNRITIYKVERSTFPLFYSYIYNEGIVSNITISPFNIKVSGLKTGESIRYYYVSTDNTAIRSYINITANGVHKLPASVSIQITEESPSSIWVGMTMTLINNENIEGVTIEILPTIENALCLDGISDFGKATGLPILKDYTVVAERARLTNDKSNPVLSKSKYKEDVDFSYGAFIFEIDRDATYSYNSRNTVSEINDNKILSYQSKYIYNKQTIIAGTTGDNDTMWLATIRDNDSRFSNLALWSLMLFPYSLSEFLLERQLKKYKAGTLYSDMIEFRPVIKSNIPYSSVSYSVNPGEYIAEGSTVTITITLSNETDKLVGVSSNAISDISISGDNGIYEITGKVTKSPQKISIVISSYLTMLNNDTLISNETLIKNE